MSLVSVLGCGTWFFPIEEQLYYYFPYRLPLGFDANLASTYTNRVNVHRYAGSGAVYTYFLQGLADGSSFTDAVNGVTVTQVSHDVNTAGTSYMDGSTRSGATYTYYAVAQDKAGNVSAASNSVTVKRSG
jgi:hypothetical protein